MDVSRGLEKTTQLLQLLDADPGTTDPRVIEVLKHLAASISVLDQRLDHLTSQAEPTEPGEEA